MKKIFQRMSDGSFRQKITDAVKYGNDQVFYETSANVDLFVNDKKNPTEFYYAVNNKKSPKFKTEEQMLSTLEKQLDKDFGWSGRKFIRKFK